MKEKKIIIDGIETNYSVREDGTVWNLKTNKQVKGTFARNEYHTVQIMVNGKRKSIMTHRLVAQAFCENPHDYNIVHHIDGNSLNNNANNLMWVDTKENNAPENRRQRKEREKQKDIIYNFKPNENWVRLTWVDDNYFISKDGRLWNEKTNSFSTGSYRNGYHRYSIHAKNYSAHLLVWEAFNGEIPKGYCIDHIDGDRGNNNLDNLRLVTQSENMKNAMKNGHARQVKVYQYDLEGNLVKEFQSIISAAEALGIDWKTMKSNLNQEYRGYIWKTKEP